MVDLSEQARARALRTVAVAGVFAQHADTIVVALVDLPGEHVAVAVVDSEHAFDRVHHVQISAMVERVPELESEGGWAMVFPAGTTRADIERRTAELADIAARRAAAIDRITARRAAR